MKQEIQQPKEPVDYLHQGCQRPWEVAVDPFRVAPRTYYVGNAWVGAYLIESSEGLILIDSTMQPQIYLVFESIRKLGFNPKDVKKILLSHGHYDHAGGIRALLEETGAELYMSKEDEAFLAEYPEQIFSNDYPFGDFTPDQYFSDDNPVVLGDRTIHTMLTPGHTPGTTSFFFDVIEKDGSVHRCGLHGGVGVNTLTDEFLEEYGFSDEMRRIYLDTMLRVRDLKIDITLGSHPAQVKMLEKVSQITDSYNPFLDPAVWPAMIDGRIAMVKELM